MKRLTILLVCALFAIACGDTEATNQTPATPEITITSPLSKWFESEGGEGEITYTIENKQKGLSLSAESNVEWITNITVGDSVTYTVEESDSAEERRGYIELNYGSASRTVTVLQRSNCDVDYQATTTSGSLYYGGSNLYNYYIVLSKVGISDNGYLIANSEYYYFDLYSATPAQGNIARIPNGTYKLTTKSNLYDGDIDAKYSNLTVTDDVDYKEIPFTNAEVVVTDDSIVAVVDFSNGERHRITYRGSLEIPFKDGNQGGGNTNSGYSTLTSDHLFNIEDGVFVGAYVGDLIGTGCNTCQVYMYEELDEVTGEEFGDTFQIDLQLPLGATDICGTYTHGTTVGHFIPGWAEDNGDGQYMQQNSWYITAGYINFAPLIEGSVIVEKDGSDIYTFTIDTIDDKGNAIKGVFKGRGQFIEW